MATAISEIDLYTSLRDKLGDAEARDLIEYVKTSRQEAKDEIKADKSLATKDDIAALRNANKDDITSLRASNKDDIAALRNANKDDIAALRNANKDDIASIRVDIANLKTEIERGLKEQLKWLIVLLMGFSSLIITVIKLL